MKKLFKIMDKLENYIMIIAMTLMVIVIFLATLFRFLGKNLIPWSEEAARYLFIWIVLIGMSSGIRDNTHYSVDAFVQGRSEKIKKILVLIRTIIMFAVISILAFYSIQMVLKIKAIGSITPSMQIPMWIAYLAIPLGFILVLLRIIQSTFFKETIKDVEEEVPIQ